MEQLRRRRLGSVVDLRFLQALQDVGAVSGSTKAEYGGNGNPMGIGPEATQEHSGTAVAPEPTGIHGSIGLNEGGRLDLKQRRKENFPSHLLQRV